ncbi:MAG: CoxG family protein [Ktedonobacterales bacterium]
MRIEGSYTIPGRIERVYEALLDPTLMGRILPGCERLIQMGPPAADGVLTFEARMRPAEDVLPVTVTLDVVPKRRPARLEFSLRGQGAGVSLTGRGGIDLVEDALHTIAGYAIEIAPVGDTTVVPQAGVVQALARVACERLAHALVARGLLAEDDAEERGRASTDADPAPARREGLAIRTPRGRIVALPARTPATSGALRTLRTSEWAQRATWMGAGMVLGMSVMGLMLVLGRWLSNQVE